ncbi:MAG TPA: PAS domain S-box protein, partial [Bacteroidales bacterium]|nr:PAS domain S-box protein [Bacteroidales bacterium]
MNRETFTDLIKKKSSILSAIALFSLSVIIAAIAIYQGYNRNISRQKVIELTAVTNLKADDISIWYNYRMKDASDLSRNEIFKAKVESYLLRKNEKNFRSLYSFLDSFRIEKEYFEICITSSEGKLLFTTDSLSERLDNELKDSILVAARSAKALSDDLYLCKTHNERHIDFISPVSIKKGSAPVIIVLRVDPEKTLFPLVRSWPSESNITKNILLRVKGDSLILLSSPITKGRFQTKGINSLNLPGGTSVSDYKGVVKLTNPFNKKELAYFRPIKGTSWHLVSMLSKQNTFSHVGNTRLIFTLTLLSLLLFIIGIVIIYMLYQRNSYMLILREINERKTAEMRQKALYRVAESMLISPSVSDLSNVIIEQIESVIKCSDIKIELYGRPIKNIPALSFEGTKYTSHLEKPVEGSVQSYCLKQGRSLILNSRELELLIKEGQIKQDTENMNSCLVLPLFSKTVPMASLCITSKDDGAFDESLITFLEIIVNQTRTFIDRKVNEDEVIKLSKGIIQSPVSIIITDRDSNIEYVNPKYLQVTGLKSEDIVGKKYSDVRKNFMPADTFEDMISRLSDGKDWTGELLSTGQIGEQIWESIHVSPIFDNKGNISHYISIHDDITEEKNMIEKLIVAKEKAEESDRLKTSFLANMSHEVRTPMNAIIGFAELLSFRDISKDEQMEYSQIIKQRSYELLAIIDDIIDVSRLETGKLKMFKSKVNICEILSDVYNTACTIWRESGKSSVKLELINEIPESELYAFTDSGRLRQILTNLIDNAFKF